MPPDPEETQRLLARAQSGEATAVNELLGVYREPLRRMIQLRLDRALAARLDASDVVQDVLVEANRRIRDYLEHPVIPFQVWLRQIARDHLIDAHRRHRKALRRSTDREQSMSAAIGDQSSVQLNAQLRDPECTPATAAIRRELQTRMDAAVATLEEGDREIIQMRLYEQVPNQQVAQELGLSEAAASMRFLRAIRRLHAILAQDASSMRLP